MISKKVRNAGIVMTAIMAVCICSCDAESYKLFLCSKLLGLGLLVLCSTAFYLTNREKGDGINAGFKNRGH